MFVITQTPLSIAIGKITRIQSETTQSLQETTRRHLGLSYKSISVNTNTIQLWKHKRSKRKEFTNKQVLLQQFLISLTFTIYCCQSLRFIDYSKISKLQNNDQIMGVHSIAKRYKLQMTMYNRGNQSKH